MADYSVKQLASFCNGVVFHPANQMVSRLIIDSRKLFNPQGTLFVAIEGTQHDGHHYVDELYQKGVRVFIVSKRFDGVEHYPDAAFIMVESTLVALQHIAAAHRTSIGCPVVAITGSNGKTIVKEWLSQLLGNDVVSVRSPRSYNSQVGVPLSLWLLNENTQLGIIEAGISMKGEMAVQESMIAPQAVIVTNIGPAHQENFSSLDEKLQEKLILCRHAASLFFAVTINRLQMPSVSHTRMLNWFRGGKMLQILFEWWVWITKIAPYQSNASIKAALIRSRFHFRTLLPLKTACMHSCLPCILALMFRLFKKGLRNCCPLGCAWNRKKAITIV
jgi:UDP-N-acetylmuramyl pentapeptide synthase